MKGITRASAAALACLVMGCSGPDLLRRVFTAPDALGVGALELELTGARRVQSLEPIVEMVKVSLSGANIPGTQSIDIPKQQFVSGKAVVTWTELLPGPVEVSADVLDAQSRILGQGRGEATISAGVTAVLNMAIVPATGSLRVTVDKFAPTPIPVIPEK